MWKVSLNPYGPEFQLGTALREVSDSSVSHSLLNEQEVEMHQGDWQSAESVKKIAGRGLCGCNSTGCLILSE